MEFGIIRDLEIRKRKAEEEVEYWKRRSFESENIGYQLNQIQMEKHELQKTLEESLTRYYNLYGEFERKKMEFRLMERKLNDLILSKNGADNNLNECKIVCKGMKKRISCLEEEKKVICEREMKIVELLEELKTKEKDEREKCVNLKRENDDLLCGKKRAEEEIKQGKKSFGELETHFLKLKQGEKENVEIRKEFEACKSKYNDLFVELEEKKKDFVMIEGQLNDLILSKNSVDNDLNEYKIMCNGMKEKINCLEEERKVISEREKKVVEMLEESKRKEQDQREKLVNLKRENDDLLCWKRRADEKIKEGKKSYGELRTHFLKLKQGEKENVEIRKEFEACKSKYNDLFIELEEKKKDFVMIEGQLNDLILSKNRVDNDLNEYKIMCNGMKEKIDCLEEERKVISEREKKVVEMLEESKRKEKHEREINLKRKNDELCWKKSTGDLMTHFMKLKQSEKENIEIRKEFETCKSKYDDLFVELEEKKKDFVMIEGQLNDLILSKNSVENDLNEYKIMCNGMKEKINCLEEERKVISEREKKVVEMLEESKRKENENVENRKELEASKSKCSDLSGELEEEKNARVMVERKLNDLMVKKSEVEVELQGYKVMCKGLKERITYQNVIKEREKQAENRITDLSNELKTRVIVENEKYLKMKKENEDLDCRNKRAEEEVEVCKKKLMDLERELEVRRNCNCSELSLELENTKMQYVALENLNRNLEFRKIDIETELKEYKRTCNGLREQIAHLKEDQRVISEREKRILERNLCLVEELKRMGSEEKYVQLMTENRNLECWKRRAIEEMEISKKNFRDLDTRIFRLQEENSTLRCKESHSAELQPQEMLANNEQILTSRFACPKRTSLIQGSRGPPSVDVGCEHALNVEKEKNSSHIKLGVENNTKTRKQSSELSSTGELSPLELRNVIRATGTTNVIGQSDSEEITHSKIGDSGTIHVRADNISERSSNNENDMISKRCSKRLSSNMRVTEKSSCLEDIHLIGIPKRMRVMKTVRSDTEDDDNIPIGKLKKNSQEPNEGTHNLFSVNPCQETLILSRDQNVKESVSSSKEQLISPSQSLQMKNSVSQNKNKFSSKHMSKISHQMTGNPTAENGEENVMEEFGVKSDGGFIVSGSDSEDSSNSSENARDSDFNQIISIIRRNRMAR